MFKSPSLHIHAHMLACVHMHVHTHTHTLLPPLQDQGKNADSELRLPKCYLFLSEYSYLHCCVSFCCTAK